MNRLAFIIILLLFVTPPVPADEKRNHQVFLGSGSCMSSNCHGRSNASRSPLSTMPPAKMPPGKMQASTGQLRTEQLGTSRLWTSASTIWSTDDPHAQAAETLLGENSFRMVQRLLSDMSSEQSVEDMSSVNQNYYQVLEKRCVGCHTTPIGMDNDDTRRRLERNGLTGVTCEACHGAAARWLDPHVSTEWAAVPASVKLESYGFQNTRELPTRASICLECHQGPRRDPHKGLYEVDHELIAAGHPRLMFELRTALLQLPAHWDRESDRARNAGAQFDFDAWWCGQREQAARLLNRGRMQNEPRSAFARPNFDYAQLDCFACHRKLRVESAGSRSRSEVFNTLSGLPRLEDFSWIVVNGRLRMAGEEPLPMPGALLQQPRQLAGSNEISASSSHQWPSEGPSEELLRRWDDAFWRADPQMVPQVVPAAKQCELVADIAQSLLQRPSRSWESVVQFDLAIRMLLDNPALSLDGEATSLRAVEREFTTFLSETFPDDVKHTIYASPTGYDPHSMTVLEHLRNMRELLIKLSTLPKLSAPFDDGNRR